MPVVRQVVLFCSCGSGQIRARGLCSRCYEQRRHSIRRFAGRREVIVRRDGGMCTNCPNTADIIVHHRSKRIFASLCRGCHSQVHHVRRLRLGRLSPYLETLWLELHRSQAQQLLLPAFVQESVIEQQALLFDLAA